MTVVVNANGMVIQTTFDDDIDFLNYSEIAAAFTEAQQNAMIALSRKTRGLMAETRRQAPARSPAAVATVSAAPLEIPIGDAASVADAFEERSRSVLDRAW